jgi:hypothetical protein
MSRLRVRFAANHVQTVEHMYEVDEIINEIHIPTQEDDDRACRLFYFLDV